jgi:hypothetical protein
MSLSADDDFLVAIAQQALAAYATHQLDVCRAALQSWQTEAALVVATGDSRVQHELAYYTIQVDRWQDYLERLRTESHGVASVLALMSLDISPSG